MLVNFKTKKVADVMMFAEHAMPILRSGGRAFPDGFPERGVITAEQLPEMIRGIEAALAKSPEVEPDHHHDDPDRDPVHPMSQPVSLRQRAYPLLDMLRQAAAAQDDVMWGAADTSW